MLKSWDVLQIIFNITVQKKQLEFPADTPQKFKVGYHLQRPTSCTTGAARSWHAYNRCPEALALLLYTGLGGPVHALRPTT